MATSESDDFESADEELTHDVSTKRNYQQQQWSSPTTIGSDSDDDTEFVPRTPRTPSYVTRSDRFSSPRTSARTGVETPAKVTMSSDDDKALKNVNTDEGKIEEPVDTLKSLKEETESLDLQQLSPQESPEIVDKKLTIDENESKNKTNISSKEKISTDACPVKPKGELKGRREGANHLRKSGGSQLGAKKLGSRITQNSDNKGDNDKEVSVKSSTGSLVSSNVTDDLTESDMPEEMKSNKKFKEIFKPEGWEGLGDDIELPEELTEEKLQPVLERLSLAGQESENSSGVWGGWGNWGVSSLINTATAGVSTLTSHVSQQLTLLEESMGVSESAEDAKADTGQESPDDVQPVPQESQSSSGFGFGNFMLGVSSITKLVETTGSKVMSGGLDTLEAIGKKTMEVLQDGDPGLKKKRAFFLNESDKPNLSQVLREAKDKADTAEKSIEEKQRARKIHFESLFDDYQGLVHLEALEMLSKQSNIRIQQHLINLDESELKSIQETLEEVKELCDLGDEIEDGDDETEKDLKARLKEACNDLGISISYTEKLYAIWEEAQSYLKAPVAHSDQEVFECAVSTLAQFTAFSVERFHKTAELLLIKERRSTVNEADALVQLTHILSQQIGVLANCFCDTMNELAKDSDKSENINANITTIFMEATNASTYIQDAFRLLIPIVQVGAI